MIDNLTEDLWHRLQEIFDALIIAIEPMSLGVKHTAGKSSSSTFPLRAYLSFMKSKNGDEIALTVDVRCKGIQLFIESDISNDEGIIIAEGPAMTITKKAVLSISGIEIQKWIIEFESFLQANSELLKDELLKLSN